MEDIAALTIFCPEKVIQENNLPSKAHENRATALSNVFSGNDFWTVKNWGFTKSEEFHDPVYLIITYNQAEKLQIRYIEEKGTLIKVQLPKSVADLVNLLMKEQVKSHLGRFTLFILENRIHIDCESDGTISFQFDMCDHKIYYEFNDANLDIGAEPLISLKS